MARPLKGDVVAVPFPFTDLSQSKRRPALVVAAFDDDDVILCQITSQHVRDRYAIPLDSRDFAVGSLRLQSNIRPNRLFTAAGTLIAYTIGRLHEPKVQSVTDALIRLLKE